jgi:hypothetical protein
MKTRIIGFPVIFMSSSAIDSASIWLTESLLLDSTHEADRLAVAQIKKDNAERPLDELLEDVQDARREEPGQFGLGYAAALVFPWLLPAVHSFVKTFAKKFAEGAASESGKMTAAALKNRISLALSKDTEPNLQRETVDELERCLVDRARAMNLPRASYEDIILQIRNNPHLVL